MQTTYRLKAPIQAILDKADGQQVSVTIPVGALLVRPFQPQEKATTLFGMLGLVSMYWESRHYLVYPNDLALKAELVESA
jgi:hypothetical protein